MIDLENNSNHNDFGEIDIREVFSILFQGKKIIIFITGLISINSPTYVDKFAVSPRVSEIEGPTAVTVEGDTHFLTVVSCDFTANA